MAEAKKPETPKAANPAPGPQDDAPPAPTRTRTATSDPTRREPNYVDLAEGEVATRRGAVQDVRGMAQVPEDPVVISQRARGKKVVVGPPSGQDPDEIIGVRALRDAYDSSGRHILKGERTRIRARDFNSTVFEEIGMERSLTEANRTIRDRQRADARLSEAPDLSPGGSPPQEGEAPRDREMTNRAAEEVDPLMTEKPAPAPASSAVSRKGP